MIASLKTMITTNASLLKKVYKKRPSSSHKYDFGHLLIIGGSKMYSGAPALAALAAYRTGVDLVTVAAPERAANIIASFSPEIITYPLKGMFLNKKHLKELLNLTKNKSAVIIGGGLEKKIGTLSAVLSFLKKVNLPCVIDADAIHAVAKNKKILRKTFVITPHTKEFYILTGVNLKNEKLNRRIKTVKDYAIRLNTTVLLKGNPDIISDGKKIILNKTGNPYMTKGGTGDTLSGILGSLLAQGQDPLVAGSIAAYINGRAGDIAAKEKKQAFTAIDLVNAIHKIF